MKFMDWQGILSLALTLGALLILATTRIGPHLVMMVVLSILSVTGILTATEALSGFSNSGVITVAAMFVVAAGLHGSGGIDLLVNRFLGRPKTVRSALTRMFAPVALLSGFLNNTPVVATMIPAIHAWSRQINIAPSKLMIPLSYTAILGGTLTLIGTSTNLVVNGQYQVLTGEADRGDQQAFGNLREFTLEVSVAKDGPLVGKTVASAGLRHLRRVYLVEIERGGTVVTAVPSEEKLQGGDRLVFAGDTEAISDLLRINGLVPSTENEEGLSLDTDRAERRLVEVVVSPHCDAVGHAIRDSGFRSRYGAVVLAVARHGERVQGNLGTIELAVGDTLLLEARPAFVSRQRYNKDFLLVNERNTDPPRHERAYLSWAILGGIVALAGLGLTSMLNAALLGSLLMILSGCCSVNQAEKNIDMMVIVTIAAAFALGMALEKTGVAAFLADNMIQLGSGKPWLLLILCYLLVSILTELITNNASAVLVLPIVLKMTEQAGLNNEPFIFAIIMAASASFATPLGYQTNLMVYGPGGYRFSDFLRVGVPMNLLIGVVTITVLLIGWPLS